MGNLVLLVEHDESARRRWRRKLEGRGYEAVEAGSAVSALELLQRVPKAFRLVLVQADLPGLPGTALIETLRLFRPELPVFCLGSAEGAAVEVGCPTVSEAGEELELHLQAFADGGDGWRDTSRLAPEAIRRACERYDATRDLVEAAYEITKGLPDR
jgi:CheY-like chemotaxis protein